MQVPSEVQKPIKNAKVRFLPAEEAINIRPGTTTTRQITRANLGTPSERTNVVAKNATSECRPLTENTIFGSTAKRPKTILHSKIDLENQLVLLGSFEVLDHAPDERFYDGFLAHLPVKVSRKVYEFSKKIAGVLQFQLHSRCDIWPEDFQTNFPDGNDIALYFYPGNFERSKRRYTALLKSIEQNDMALKSLMGQVNRLERKMIGVNGGPVQ
uniref:AIPP2-like SPOC-like domain-containing protein n=1 Tax=Fagus sylvatica TaxID=28930 RepID=A0A2N9EUC1_FAGSY